MVSEEKIYMTARLSGKDVAHDYAELSDYLIVAGYEILSRCYPFGYEVCEKVPRCYEMLQCKIAAYLINKQGADGQTSHSENGISRTYESGGVPESLLGQITPRGAVY